MLRVATILVALFALAPAAGAVLSFAPEDARGAGTVDHRRDDLGVGECLAESRVVVDTSRGTSAPPLQDGWFVAQGTCGSFVDTFDYCTNSADGDHFCWRLSTMGLYAWMRLEDEPGDPSPGRAAFSYESVTQTARHYFSGTVHTIETGI